MRTVKHTGIIKLHVFVRKDRIVLNTDLSIVFSGEYVCLNKNNLFNRNLNNLKHLKYSIVLIGLIRCLRFSQVLKLFM